MSWIAIVFWVITHIPDFISVIQAIISLIHTLPAAQSNSIRASISDAIKSGDKEAVKAVLTQHQGMPGNPPSLV